MKVSNIVLITLPFLFGLFTFYALYNFENLQEERSRLNALTFSNTQVWDPYFLETAQSASGTERYVLPPSPKNFSRATKKELAILHEYQNNRSEEHIKEIQNEVIIAGAFFGTQTYAELTDEVRRPMTFALMQYVIDFEFPIIIEQKLRFNRVRPSFLDPTIVPAIDVPEHPAYPSGHSAQAHIRAYIFSMLDPENKETYVSVARRIARNREIAGVHYPSDSKAGVLMAEQIFEALLQDEVFLTLLKEAKTEW